ncbi:MAG: hypothetical protein EOM50_08860 [Erysipelotrichia bacterium]|nr:hypothetical protein [Erysipelotrichia bacterium]NCC54371.1 hypothetical protein [Erysipelotrichia bacterium]
MEDLVFMYKKKKLYANFIVILLALVIILAALMSVQTWHFFNVLLFAILFLLLLSFVIYRTKQLKSITYFIRCDAEGIYTRESFYYCEWEKIKEITLKRYMGYQTLFFQIDEKIESKMKPIKQKDKLYYVLPLADCKGNPKEIVEKIKKFAQI